MKKILRNYRSAAFIIILSSMFFISCKKDVTGGGKVDYHDAPRKQVPAALVGDWLTTSVSNTNVEDNHGHSVPAWTFGATFRIGAGGTGFEAITSSYTYLGSSTQKEDVNSDGTYVIEEIDENTYSFKYYPVQGKVYDNDVYKHDLSSDKVYPNGSYSWTVTLGEDSRGKYFSTSDAKYYKK